MIRVRRFSEVKTRGVSAFVAVLMVAVLLGMALSIDLGMAYTARSEAQRVADAAALAGASAFLDYADPEDAVSEAQDRAYAYACVNQIRNVPTDSAEVTLEVLPDERRVRVWIARPDLPTWFARLLGLRHLNVRAMATAEASLSASATGECVLPFAVADPWDDMDDDDSGDRIPNGGENWDFDPGDNYHPYSPDPPSEYGPYQDTHGTGFGSDLRGAGGDYGRRFWIKAGPRGQSGKGKGGSAGGLDEMVVPGNFFLWAPPSPDNGCDPESTPRGMPWIAENIAGCNECLIRLGVAYTTEPGNKAALKDAMEDLLASDRDAYWDEDCNCIEGSRWGDHDAAVAKSGRVRVLPIWDPNQGADLHGRDQLEFNNFARVFVEGGGVDPPAFQIYGRFMGRVSGSGPPPDGGGGTLISYLRLVQ